MRFLFAIGLLTILLATPRSFATAATVTMTMRILPVRIVVLDERGMVVSLWSNVDHDATAYRLEARSKTPDGALVPLTAAILADYRRLVPRVRNTAGFSLPETGVSSTPLGEPREYHSVFDADGRLEEVVTVVSV